MKNVIIGTAGHIDHGKSTLIKALTGRETDRLKEEKNRGISIELGFTYFDLPSGKRAGIIDVPGHEKFIKNMLAGVVGMDMVVLVIAADEGVMPQTKEHLDILNILKVKNGIIALTKVDMVDKEWIKLVREDTEEYIKGTFLEGSPIVEVSSISKIGIKKIIEEIDKMANSLKDISAKGIARVPIDRAFTLKGFGTIITGTQLSGKINVGDEMEIFPKEKICRVRSIQVHGEDMKITYPGQRVAINITGIKKPHIDRGDVMGPVDSMLPTMMLDVKLELLKDSPRIIENRTRVRLYLGTKEILCRVILLDRDMLLPGESCYAQLRLEDKTVASQGDRFIIRFYSPMVTIGGGEILDSNPPKRKRFNKEILEEFSIKEKGDKEDIIESIIKRNSSKFPLLSYISSQTLLIEEELIDILKILREKNVIIVFDDIKNTYVIHMEYFMEVSKKIIDYIKKYHEKYPLRQGISKEELRSRFLSNATINISDKFFEKMNKQNKIEQKREYIYLKGFQVKYKGIYLEIKENLEQIYKSFGYCPKNRDEILAEVRYNKDDVEEVLLAMILEGTLVSIKEDMIMHKDFYKSAIKELKYVINNDGFITVGQFRDYLKTNRKYAIYLLEHFDSKKITVRDGNKRILYKKD